MQGGGACNCAEYLDTGFIYLFTYLFISPTRELAREGVVEGRPDLVLADGRGRTIATLVFRTCARIYVGGGTRLAGAAMVESARRIDGSAPQWSYVLFSVRWAVDDTGTMWCGFARPGPPCIPDWLSSLRPVE